MTDAEIAKKYAEDKISLAVSMYNPRAESIAETACLYGLTYKNKQLAKAKEIIKTFLGFAEAFGYSPSMDKFITEAEQFIENSEVEK
jgi:hypothetical protein